jgi:hypothetical protein
MQNVHATNDYELALPADDNMENSLSDKMQNHSGVTESKATRDTMKADQIV